MGYFIGTNFIIRQNGNHVTFENIRMIAIKYWVCHGYPSIGISFNHLIPCHSFVHGLTSLETFLRLAKPLNNVAPVEAYYTTNKGRLPLFFTIFCLVPSHHWPV